MPNFEIPKVPSNYQTATEDVAGYWDPDKCPIYGCARSAKVFDGNITAEKPSTLILFELSRPCEIQLKKEKGQAAEYTTAQKGDVIGVWAKPGMKALRDLCDVDVIMWQKEETLNTGKPNPMKLFEIKHPPGVIKKRIPVMEDKRDKSAHLETLLTGPRAKSKIRPDQPAIAAGGPDDDEIPF